MKSPKTLILTFTFALLIFVGLPAGAQSYSEGPDYKFFHFDYSAQGNTFTDVRSTWNLYGGAENIPFYIHQDVIAQPGYEAAIRSAFQTFEDDPTSNISFNYQGSTSVLSEIRCAALPCPLPLDGVNVVSFGQLPTGIIGRGGLAGEFFINVDGSPNGTGNGNLDITLSTAASLAVGSAPRTIDVETLVLHELGHALGLDHPTANSATVMWSPIIEGSLRRGLHPADRIALAEIYPAEAVPPPQFETGGFVPVSPTRILDSRPGQQPAGETGANTAITTWGSGAEQQVQITGNANIPTNGTVTAVAAHVTSVTPTQNSYLSAGPNAVDPLNPTAAKNYGPTQTGTGGHAAITNDVLIIPVNPTTGTIYLYNTGNVDLVIDIVGYYTT